MSLQHFINERLKITSKSRPLKLTERTLFPTNAGQLKAVIKSELKHQGPDADLNHIDTSKITDMSKLFESLQIGNIKINEWDVSNVTNMRFMFSGRTKFNCDLSGWDVSNVTDMGFMFSSCTLFEGTGLDNWDTSNVEDMSYMFMNCDIFKSDLSGWNVSKLPRRQINIFKNCPQMKPALKPKF